jgi:hypothetical protein
LQKHIEISTLALLLDRIAVLGKLLSGKTLVPGSRLLMNAYQHRLNSSQPFDEIARPVTRLRSRNKLLQSVSYLDRARWDADLLPRVGLDGPFFAASRGPTAG